MMADHSPCRSSDARSTKRPCCAWRARTSGRRTGDAPRPRSRAERRAIESWTLLGVVKDDAEGVAQTAGDAADAVAHGHAIDAARPFHRAVTRGEDDDLTLLGR